MHLYPSYKGGSAHPHQCPLESVSRYFCCCMLTCAYSDDSPLAKGTPDPIRDTSAASPPQRGASTGNASGCVLWAATRNVTSPTHPWSYPVPTKIPDLQSNINTGRLQVRVTCTYVYARVSRSFYLVKKVLVWAFASPFFKISVQPLSLFTSYFLTSLLLQ